MIYPTRFIVLCLVLLNTTTATFEYTAETQTWSNTRTLMLWLNADALPALAPGDTLHLGVPTGSASDATVRVLAGGLDDIALPANCSLHVAANVSLVMPGTRWHFAGSAGTLHVASGAALHVDRNSSLVFAPLAGEEACRMHVDAQETLLEVEVHAEAPAPFTLVNGTCVAGGGFATVNVTNSTGSQSGTAEGYTTDADGCVQPAGYAIVFGGSACPSPPPAPTPPPPPVSPPPATPTPLPPASPTGLMTAPPSAAATPTSVSATPTSTPLVSPPPSSSSPADSTPLDTPSATPSVPAGTPTVISAQNVVEPLSESMVWILVACAGVLLLISVAMAVTAVLLRAQCCRKELFPYRNRPYAVETQAV